MTVLFAVTITGHCAASEFTSAEVRARLVSAGVEFRELRVEDNSGLYLSLTNTAITDLTILSELPITGLNLAGCRNVTNLRPLAGMPLDFLNIAGTSVADLSPLAKLPLANFFFSPEIATNGIDVIRHTGCNVNLKSPKEFWEEYDSPAATRLRRAGIGYNCLMVSTYGRWHLNLASTSISNLLPLRGMPIDSLCLSETTISDISPLRDMPLMDLDLTNTRVDDLTPLRGMKLKELWLRRIPARDFSPLKGLPIRSLELDETSISDLTPLAGMPLEWLSIRATRVIDLSPLRDLPLTVLLLPDTAVADLSPLRTLKLVRLQITNTRVSDLTPLTEVPLQLLLLSPYSIDKGLDMLRRKTSLKEIGVAWDQLWSPEVFWSKFDSGELRKPSKAEQESRHVRK